MIKIFNLLNKFRLPFTKIPKSKTFCVMPWFNLATETNGKCKLCCVVMTNKYITDDDKEYLIYEDKIEDIWNSNYLKDVRKKLLKGEKVSDCSYCYSQDEEGQQSPRQHLNKRWFSQNIKNSINYSLKNDGEVLSLPQSLEPRPGTFCNLKCTMCWSMSSSSLYKERVDILEGKFGTPPERYVKDWKYEIGEAKKLDPEWPSRSVYIENINKCAPKMKRLYFTGGEPTLIKANIDLLAEVLKNDGKNVLIQMTTNTTILSEKLLLLLTKFNKVELTCSIDGFKDINDYIRYPSKWNQIEDNFNYLTTQKNLIVSIMVAVQAINLLSILDLLRWLSKKKGKKIHIIITFIPSPNQLTCKILPDKLISTHLLQYNDALNDHSINRYYNDVLLKIINHLKSLPKDNSEKNYQQKQFKEYTKLLDKVRKTNFEDTFPEYVTIMPS